MNDTLQYNRPAPDSDYGWEHQSLPIGCGWFGANIFGIVARDRIQITENSLQNPGQMGGLNNFAELYLHFDHRKGTDYQRGLSLADAVAYTRYKVEGVEYQREYFASYPDRALVIRLTARKPFRVRVELVVPYVKDHAAAPGDGGGKTGTVTYGGDRAYLRGRMEYYNIRFAGELAAVTDGTVAAQADGLQVEGATEVVLYMTLGTNYRLEPQVFLEEDPKKKLPDTDPGQAVAGLLDKVLAQGFAATRKRHLEDHQALYGRVTLNLGEGSPKPTDRLLKAYARGRRNPNLEALYFQYGRYLLIASSRRGTLPANLQGIWNVHDRSPWGSGYWHNINVQMNYWPAFTTNLAETFEAYADFNAAFRPGAQCLAEGYIREHMPQNYLPGHCGWTVGTGIYPYTLEGPGGHSGPGTGGLTTKLFWDYYDFTRDPEILREVTYPALRGMSEFLTRTVCLDSDGVYRADFSASPEQMEKKRYYHTRGCAFDQQMIWENGRDFLAAAQALGRTQDPAYQRQKRQQDHYKPVRIGGSGQIKEFEEEDLYGQIGEYTHRHISQLVALYPGSAINQTTPAWLDAARITLTKRGDRTTGWALAHRLNAWASLGDGERACRVLRRLLGTRTMENLWDLHPPFQIDGNFGATAGIAHMLLQSREQDIYILPALPRAWKNGEVSGLMARGAFMIDIRWEQGVAKEIKVHSKVGGQCALHYTGIGEADILGGAVAAKERDKVTLQMEAGMTASFRDIPPVAVTPTPKAVVRLGKRLLWPPLPGVRYRLYRAKEDGPDYACLPGLPKTLTPGLYRLTAQKPGCRESRGKVFYIPQKPAGLGYRLRVLWAKLYDLGFFACCEMDRLWKKLLRR